jgi:hypothetical protein
MEDDGRNIITRATNRVPEQYIIFFLFGWVVGFSMAKQ